MKYRTSFSMEKKIFTDPYHFYWRGKQKLQVPCSLWKCREVILTDVPEPEVRSAIA